MPTHICQLTLLFAIALHIPPNLSYPKLPIRFWYLAACRALEGFFIIHSKLIILRAQLVAMPEAAIHKHTCAVFFQNQVRMSRQPLVVQSVSEPSFPQPSPHYHLWLSAFRANSRHIFVPLLSGKVVHFKFIFDVLMMAFFFLFACKCKNKS
jgi:hypothetical protein